MSIRLVLAVVVTLALLAGSIPVIEVANQARAEQTLAETSERLSHTITTIERRDDPVPPGVPGARRRVRVDMPDNGGAARFVIDPDRDTPGSSPTHTATISYHVSDGQRHREPIAAELAIVDSRGRPLGNDTPLVLEEDTTLTLSYRLLDGTPTVTVARGFIPEDRTNQSHVGAAG